MLSLSDWVTPWYERGVPFWGKPPLSFWTTALSFSIGGVNEFSARLPHFLTALGVGWVIWDWARQQSKQAALAALALLAGCSLTLIAAGAVMTDMTLVLGMTLVMRGFWQALRGPQAQRNKEIVLFFLGLVIGLLAKGPLALVLAGLPLGLWTLFNRQWRQVWLNLPWWRGSLLVVLLVVPWYVMAELRTPGFLNYFLVGEHWHRFVTPGWSGDRYGGAHSASWGSIWAYAWFATLPWALLLPLAWWRWRKTKAQFIALQESAALAAPDHQPLQNYLLLWSLAPALFFTFAGNIIWTYVLPAIPPLALLGSAWLSRSYDDERVNQWLARGVAVSALCLVGFVVTLNLKSFEDFQTTKLLIADVNTLNTRSSALLFYPARPYSASFYTLGQAKSVTQMSEVWERMAWPQSFLAVKVSEEATLPLEVRSQLHFLLKRGDYKLFEMGNNLLPQATATRLPLVTP